VRKITHGMGLLMLAVAVVGCASTAKIDTVKLMLQAEKVFTDTPGAKRVVVCRYFDRREDKTQIGEDLGVPSAPSYVGKVTRRYVSRDPVTDLLARRSAERFKELGFNVALADAPPNVDGDTMRALLKQYQGDFVITGEVNEFFVRGHDYDPHIVYAVAAVRLSIFNDKGRIRMEYPARQTESTMLGEEPYDPQAAADFMQMTVMKLYDGIFTNARFLEAMGVKQERGISEVIEPLGLTDEQRGKLEEWLKGQDQNVDPGALAGFLKTILTEEQRKKLEEQMEAPAPPGETSEKAPEKLPAGTPDEKTAAPTTE